MGGWGTVLLWFYLWLQRFNTSVFSWNAQPLNDWDLIQTSTAPVAAKIPLKSCYLIFLPNPDKWVMRMQKMWSHLGKRWCQHKEASLGRQGRGREDDKGGHCHCWDEFSAEKCFWNAYVIPHPRVIVWELRSIPLLQRFPTSWNNTKRACTAIQEHAFPS